MSKIKINAIWNISSNFYAQDLNFISAFNNYLIIIKKDNFFIKNSKIAKFFSNLFNVENKVVICKKSFDFDSVMYEEGKRYEIYFEKNILDKITKFLRKYEINFCIIDYNLECIFFENYNDYNGYNYLIELLAKTQNVKDIILELGIFNNKIRKHYKIISKSSFVDLLDLQTEEIYKYKISEEFIVTNALGKIEKTYEKGFYKEYEYISDYSVMAREMLGKFENDIFTVNNIKYKVISVKSKDEL